MQFLVFHNCSPGAVSASHVKEEVPECERDRLPIRSCSATPHGGSGESCVPRRGSGDERATPTLASSHFVAKSASNDGKAGLTAEQKGISTSPDTGLGVSECSTRDVLSKMLRPETKKVKGCVSLKKRANVRIEGSL